MDPDPDPTQDPTPFFSDFKDAKKIFIFFLSYLQAHYLPSQRFNFLLKYFVLKSYFASIISVRSHLYEKREGSGAGSVPLANGSGS